MSDARFIIGDTRAVVAAMPDDSVDLVLTSPPFLALRSYLPAGHPDKDHEIGSEATPAAYIAPHGSICVELGDTYSGSGGAGGDYGTGGLRDGAPAFTGSARAALRNRPRDTRPGREGTGYESPPRPESPGGTGWPLAKSLTMIPELFRVGLAYGINPLTGTESPAGRWRVRNVVRWHRPNPPVGALGDKYRPSTTDMVIACKSPRRWFDAEAVRQAGSANTHRRLAQGIQSRLNDTKQSPDGNRLTLAITEGPPGTPPLDTWTIPTHGFKGAHYATWPSRLCQIPIESMCPREVCRTCGEPRRRITEFAGLIGPDGQPAPTEVWASGTPLGKGAHSNKKSSGTTTTTIGWTDCGHDDHYRRGIRPWPRLDRNRHRRAKRRPCTQPRRHVPHRRHRRECDAMNLPRRRPGPPRRKKHPIQPPWLLRPAEETGAAPPERTDPAYRRTVEQIRGRAGGRCEAALEGCTTWGEHPHHRFPASWGGAVDVDMIWLRWVCPQCHARIHDPKYRRVAEIAGLLVPRRHH